MALAFPKESLRKSRPQPARPQKTSADIAGQTAAATADDSVNTNAYGYKPRLTEAEEEALWELLNEAFGGQPTTLRAINFVWGSRAHGTWQIGLVS